MPSENSILAAWNHLGQETAAKAILPCNGAQAWSIGMVDLRPFATPDQIFAASDKVWGALPEQDWRQAFDSHPRLGSIRAKSASTQSLAWSAHEQSAAQSDETTRNVLAAANRAYEAKFSRIFILCATGRTTPEILAILQQRLNNDPETELCAAVEQQRLITQLRLRKWLQLPVLTCAELPATN